MAELTIEILTDTGEERGQSFQLIRQVEGFLPAIRDLFVLSVRPGFHRGNHFRRNRREVLLIHWKSDWRLAWRRVGQEAKYERRFDGEGAALVFIPAMISHAVANDGAADLWITAFLDGPFDPGAPDVAPDQVL